jgi:hypothetical protein
MKCCVAILIVYKYTFKLGFSILYRDNVTVYPRTRRSATEFGRTGYFRDVQLCGIFVKGMLELGPPLWSSGQSSWLLTQMSRARFPALPDFLSSSGSGTGSIQPL